VDAHERQESEARGGDERRDGQSVPECRLEYRGGISGNREAICSVIVVTSVRPIVKKKKSNSMRRRLTPF